MRGCESNEARTSLCFELVIVFPSSKLSSAHSVLRRCWCLLTLNTGILKPPNQRQPAIRPFDPSPLCNSPFGHYRNCERTINPRLSLSFFLPVRALSLALGSNVYAFTEIAGGIVREKKEGLFFSLSLFLFFLCNLLPSETINAHSTSTSRHSFDVYSGSRPLSFSAACLPIPLYPFLFPSLTLYGYCTIK